MGPATPRPDPVPSDDGLLRALYHSELSYVWNVFLRLGVPARDVEDLVHDLFLTLGAQLPSYDRARPVRPWLFGIAFRIASNYRRSHQVSHEILREVPEVADDAPPLEDQLDAQRLRALLVEALDTLDLDRRAVFVMHEFEAFSVPQIADALGVPLNTAYSRLRLARVQVITAARRLALRGRHR